MSRLYVPRECPILDDEWDADVRRSEGDAGGDRVNRCYPQTFLAASQARLKARPRLPD